MELSTTLFWMQKLLSVSLLIQGAEYFWIHHKYQTNPLRKYVSILQMALSIVLFFYIDVYLLSVLLLISFDMSRSFRGFFNGGSDSMTLLNLASLWGFLFFQNINHNVAVFFIYYLGIQVALSYFISGYVKIKEFKWRSGEALNLFLNCNAYGPIQNLNLKKWLMPLSWIVIGVELIFPLTLLSSNFLIGFLVFFAAFHLINVYVFGLNRFFYAWIAAYPAVIFLSFKISQMI